MKRTTLQVSNTKLTLLFILRLFFYLSVAALVLLHPGITVSYDRTGLVLWFLIVPLQALIAFLPSPRGRLWVKFLLSFIPLFLISVLAGGFSLTAMPLFFAGLVSFFITLLLFHYPRWGKFSVLEPFFLAWICFRLLVFSRSGEEAAGESMGLTQFILVWTAVVFLFHSLVVYFCLNRASSGASRREGLIFVLFATTALVLVIFILPPDFVRHTVIDNLLSERMNKMTKPSDSQWGMEGGGDRRRGRQTLPGQTDGQGPGLRGLSEHDWPGEGRLGRDGRGDGDERQQYAVMVVASKNEPVYMAGAIRGRLDPVLGFLHSPDEALNRLPFQRFFVTWFDNEPVLDLGREKWEVFSLSTQAQNYLPYRPFAIEPTVQSVDTGPFRYIHRIVSNVHQDDPLDLLRLPVRELSPLEKAEFASYLELPLTEADREIFAGHLDSVLDSWQLRREDIMGETSNGYMEKVVAILLGFSGYQYYVNNSNSISISGLVDFLLETKEGDCVEFSNSAALLGRFAGIPSRVVTGYLASEGLQSMAHLQGLVALRSRIPVLQSFPFGDLFLVTDAHAHSWTQFYIPDYGWLDFEATAFAIPPAGLGDGNLRDVVIPLFDEAQVFSQVRAFPWRAVFRALCFILILLLLAAYVLRYGRELVLYLTARQGGRAGARSLYLLLLARLAADGKPIKPVSKTAPEYALLFDQTETQGPFAAFAGIYTELRWRSFSDKAEEDSRFLALKDEYQKILAANKRKGLWAFFVRLFSLRGLLYL